MVQLQDALKSLPACEGSDALYQSLFTSNSNALASKRY